MPAALVFVERGMKKAGLTIVSDRSHGTLDLSIKYYCRRDINILIIFNPNSIMPETKEINNLNVNYIPSVSRIISDQWSAYSFLASDLSYIYTSVNHS